MLVNGSFEGAGGWSSFGTYTYSQMFYAGPAPPGQPPTDHYYHTVNQPATATQVVDLEPTLTAASIDAGGASYSFGAWTAGWTGDGPEGDHPGLELKFYNGTGAGGAQVGSTVLIDGGDFVTHFVETADGSAPGVDNWKRYLAEGDIPSGARSASVDILRHTELGGNGNDNYVDLITLDVTQIPEPTSVILLGIGGLSALGLGRRRKRRRS
ncbi:MAG: PEP-CTERM sorting domain-containing protein [Planctomycetes bacterium]|nr:PEP-CTERM sorting domain-containing protein [Planctomycetota bacterium]